MDGLDPSTEQASVRERMESLAAPTRGRWVAGSSPAMVRFCDSIQSDNALDWYSRRIVAKFADMKKKSAPVLPDLLAPGLDVVFCGTAPGTVSAQRKQYYAHPQNKFWRALHDIGLTPRLLQPSEYETLLTYRIGLTDIAKHVSGMDNQLPRGSLGKEAIADLRARIETYKPKILAFTSLTGGRKLVGSDASFGRQTIALSDTEVWILPSPSPAAHWNWRKNEKVWRALAAGIRKLR
jgi:TDG/mug DNA glycosylase family protein